jgi:hydrogenase maturation protease
MSAISEPIPLLVLGLGNVLCQDDGLGAAAVARILAEYETPGGVCVLDGGTLGLNLLPYIEDAERVILVDAIRGEGPPGTFVRLSGDEVGPAVADRLSPHQVGVSDLIEAARWRGRLPKTLVLLGLVPESLGLGVDRSPAVEEMIPELVLRVVAEARSLGFDLVRRPPGAFDACRASRPDSLARALGV